VPWVALVLVVARGTRQAESVVASAGILHHLQQRLVVDGEVLRGEAGRGIEAAVQGARRRRVDVAQDTARQRAQRESLEIGALPALHVEDLDPLAGLHLVGAGRAGIDGRIQERVGQRCGRRAVRPVLRVRAFDEERQAARRRLLEGLHRRAWSGDHQNDYRIVPGVLLSNREIALEQPALYDVTIAVLDDLGVAPLPEMIGEDAVR